MAHGGSREGAGRRKGSQNKLTLIRQEVAAAAIGEKTSPLELLLQIMRDETYSIGIRMQAAIAAAPYVHPKLASVQYKGDPASPLQHAHSVHWNFVDPHGSNETVTRIELVAGTRSEPPARPEHPAKPRLVSSRPVVAA